MSLLKFLPFLREEMRIPPNPTPPPQYNNYRHIVEHTCIGYNCTEARRVQQGHTSIILFPNGPTNISDYAKLHQTIFALSLCNDISTIRSCLLLVHLPNIPGGHWTFISITLGDTVLVSYHDSIQALSINFEQFTESITDFLRTLNITGHIKFSVALNPQQMDGHSCGVYALVGMLALAHGNTHWTLSETQATCMRQDVCQSVIDVTLITRHSLHNAAHIPDPNFVEPTETMLNSKRKHSTQGLITDSFKRYRDNTSAGQQGLKRTYSPSEDLPPKRSRQDAKLGNDITRIQNTKPLKTGFF